MSALTPLSRTDCETTKTLILSKNGWPKMDWPKMDLGQKLAGPKTRWPKMDWPKNGLSRSPRGRRRRGVGAKIDLFFAEGRGFESKSVTDTRATTDKNDPIFEHGVQTREKSGWTNMGQNATWGSGV